MQLHLCTTGGTKKKSSKTFYVLEWGIGGKKREQGKAVALLLLLLENGTLEQLTFWKA